MNMTDITRAIAAAREAMRVLYEAEGGEYVSAVVQSAVEKSIRALRDLLAALDAARGEAVAFTWVSHEGKRHFKEWNPKGFTLQGLMEDGIEWTMLYAAPPAAPANSHQSVASDYSAPQPQGEMPTMPPSRDVREWRDPGKPAKAPPAAPANSHQSVASDYSAPQPQASAEDVEDVEDVMWRAEAPNLRRRQAWQRIRASLGVSNG